MFEGNVVLILVIPMSFLINHNDTPYILSFRAIYDHVCHVIWNISMKSHVQTEIKEQIKGISFQFGFYDLSSYFNLIDTIWLALIA